MNEVSLLQVKAYWSSLKEFDCIIQTQNCEINLPGVLKTGLPEILSQVQHIGDNLSKLYLAQSPDTFSVKITISLFRTNHPQLLSTLLIMFLVSKQSNWWL